MTKLLTVEEFRGIARKNPGIAEQYICDNESELEAQGLIKQFDEILDYWIDMWEGEAFEEAQKRAFYERMDYR